VAQVSGRTNWRCRRGTVPAGGWSGRSGNARPGGGSPKCASSMATVPWKATAISAKILVWKVSGKSSYRNAPRDFTMVGARRRQRSPLLLRGRQGGRVSMGDRSDRKPFSVIRRARASGSQQLVCRPTLDTAGMSMSERCPPPSCPPAVQSLSTTGSMTFRSEARPCRLPGRLVRHQLV
jgi:hypothetical protein